MGCDCEDCGVTKFSGNMGGWVSVNACMQQILNQLQMSEGRRTQVTLLDDRRVELVVQPKLISGDLLDLVISYFSLKEKEFFGLAFMDQTGHYNWLQLDRKVLDHEFPRKTGTLSLYFRVQFFIESISHLRDSITIELFYLQAKAAIFKGDIEVDSETAFELGAYVLQATDGDHTSDSKAREELKKLPVLPQTTLQEHPSLPYCEERVLFYYKRLGGLNRGQCVVCYMQLVENLATYGVHYYEAKDKSGIPWWVGLSFKGVGQYDLADRVTPRKVFQWRQLQNIYYRERKFSIEVIDPRRVTHMLSSLNLYQEAREEPEEKFDELCDAISDPTTQVSVSKRTFGASNATVHAWYGHPVLIRSMWAMAVSQHQFYLDKKHNRERYPAQRSFSQIATDLAVSTGSLTTSSQASQASDYSSSVDTGTGTNDSIANLTVLKDLKGDKDKICSSRDLLAMEGEAARKEMIVALLARKSALEERLKDRFEELKKACVQEAELTGELPLDFPHTPGEALPHIKRRVTTAFTLSDKTVNAEHESAENRQLSQLETEQEIQSKITTAARKLADDPTISKKVRKTRRESYKTSARKLSNIEEQLKDLRIRLGLDLPDKMAPKAEQEDMSGFDTINRRGGHSKSSPPPIRSLFGRDRGRSKSKDDGSNRVRSKSVPRQLLNGGWRSPSATRKNQINLDDQRRPSNPVEIYSDIPQQTSTTSLPRRIKEGLRSRSKSHANYFENTVKNLPGKPRTLKSAASEGRLHLKSARSEEFLTSGRLDSVQDDVVFTIGGRGDYEDNHSADNVYAVNSGHEPAYNGPEPVYNVNSTNEPDYITNGDHDPSYSGHESGYNTNTEPSYNNGNQVRHDQGHQRSYRDDQDASDRYRDNQEQNYQRYRDVRRHSQQENPYESIDNRVQQYPPESPRQQRRVEMDYSDSPPIPLQTTPGKSRPRTPAPASYNDSLVRTPPTGRGHNNYNGSPRRHKIVNHNADRPPPPSYYSASSRKMSNSSGRYYESPDFTNQRSDDYIPTPMRQMHAASYSDLQQATRMQRNFSHTDDDIEYHQPATSVSQPPSPKKHHGSMGNLLNIKSNSQPIQHQVEEEEQDFNNYSPYRGRPHYRSQQYQSYSSRTTQHDSVTKRFEFDDVNSYINQPYTNHRNEIDQGSSSSAHSSIASERDLMPPPPPPPADHHRRRHNSFSSNQSTSSHSSHSSLNNAVPPQQANSASFHVQQNPAFNRLNEYTTNYASMQHTASYSSISSQNSSTSSASTYPEPQAAHVYRTTSSMVLRPQPAIGSGIAVSKVHYQPVTPMTCEPVSRSKKLAHGSVSSLHSITAIEGNLQAPAPIRHEEVKKTAVQPRPDSYATPSEEGSFQGDAGESLADAFSEEMLTWFDEQEGVVKTGTLV